MSHNILLVGYRCTGKTTVGRLLARRIGWSFADVDDRIEAGAGKSIAEIFAAGGETEFRDREAAALAELCDRSACVIATGGGAVLRAVNREVLKASGFVVWLTATPETVWARLEIDPTTAARRPNLTATGGQDEVRELIATRERLYHEVADFTVASDTLSPEAVADAIFTAWNGRSTSRS
jgi:shikimate kinase